MGTAAGGAVLQDDVLVAALLECFMVLYSRTAEPLVPTSELTGAWPWLVSRSRGVLRAHSLHVSWTQGLALCAAVALWRLAKTTVPHVPSRIRYSNFDVQSRSGATRSLVGECRALFNVFEVQPWTYASRGLVGTFPCRFIPTSREVTSY